MFLPHPLCDAVNYIFPTAAPCDVPAGVFDSIHSESVGLHEGMSPFPSDVEQRYKHIASDYAYSSFVTISSSSLSFNTDLPPLQTHCVSVSVQRMMHELFLHRFLQPVPNT